MDPPVQAEECEALKVICLMKSNQTERKLKVMVFIEFALHLQKVQRVRYKFWEVLRGVIGGGVDGFVYHAPLVRTLAANRKVARSHGGKSPRPHRTLLSMRRRRTRKRGKKWKLNNLLRRILGGGED